jgi:hypothetical protein
LLSDRDIVNLSGVLKVAIDDCSDDTTGEIPISVDNQKSILGHSMKLTNLHLGKRESPRKSNRVV